MKQPMPRLSERTKVHRQLSQWHDQLATRRRFLLQLAGGSLTALFPCSESAVGREHTALTDAQRWRVVDAVQQHLLPSETDAPGAKEIGALGYLRFIVADATQEAEERQFLLQGVEWLEDMARQLTKQSFFVLAEDEREQVLRRIEQSRAGKNWLSLMLYYLFEALLSDPVYGGNAAGAGWRWLEHIPGFPRPPEDKRYPELLKL